MSENTTEIQVAVKRNRLTSGRSKSDFLGFITLPVREVEWMDWRGPHGSLAPGPVQPRKLMVATYKGEDYITSQCWLRNTETDTESLFPMIFLLSRAENDPEIQPDPAWVD